MTSRTYRLGQRLTSATRTRERLLVAARRMLMTKGGLTGFSLEAVAKRAGVTRLTVYHQFGSKVGLLESVYDDLARRGEIAEHLGAAFQGRTAEDCLDGVVAAFVHFWHSERSALRRLRGMAALDPGFKGVTQRDARRRQAVQAALRRLAQERGQAMVAADDKIALLTMLTSFEAFDALAGSKPDVSAVTAQLQRLVYEVLKLRPAGDSSSTG